MTPLVIYHANCWDGFCAAWVARMALGEIEAVPAYYGVRHPPMECRNVYILDFCYKRNEMRAILSEAQSVAVLDHHKTAEAELDGLMDEFIQRPDLIQNQPGSELPRIHLAARAPGLREHQCGAP